MGFLSLLAYWDLIIALLFLGCDSSEPHGYCNGHCYLLRILHLVYWELRKLPSTDCFGSSLQSSCGIRLLCLVLMVSLEYNDTPYLSKAESISMHESRRNPDTDRQRDEGWSVES